MQRPLRHVALLAAAVLGLSAGCTRSGLVQEKKTPPDPLLLSKKPVDGRFGAPPSATARAYPQPPSAPSWDAAAAAPRRGTPPVAAQPSSDVVIRPPVPE